MGLCRASFCPLTVFELPTSLFACMLNQGVLDEKLIVQVNVPPPSLKIDKVSVTNYLATSPFICYTTLIIECVLHTIIYTKFKIITTINLELILCTSP